MELIFSELTDTNLTFKFSNGVVYSRRVDLMPVSCSAVIPPWWENICNGCGDCCSYRWVGLDGKVNLTEHYCKFFDKKTRQCTIYSKRETTAGGCAKMAPGRLPAGMPETCSYVKAGYG